MTAQTAPAPDQPVVTPVQIAAEPDQPAVAASAADAQAVQSGLADALVEAPALAVLGDAVPDPRPQPAVVMAAPDALAPLAPFAAGSDDATDVSASAKPVAAASTPVAVELSTAPSWPATTNGQQVYAPVALSVADQPTSLSPDSLTSDLEMVDVLGLAVAAPA